MKWIRLSDYAIQSDAWTICKCIVSGKEVYVLWSGEKRVGNFDAANKAKEAAK